MTYRVHYGSCTSYLDFSQWAEASRFIRHLLMEGTRVREVEALP